MQKLNTLNLRLFHPPLNPCNHFPTVLIKTNWYTISYKFYGCTGLKSIKIPASVSYIGKNPFRGCSNLEKIVVDENNPNFNSANNCNAIIKTSTKTLISGCKNTVIPNDIVTIDDYAMSGCSGISSITIPNTCTKIGNQAFRGCTGLTSITIPKNVASIGEYSFADCPYIVSMVVESGNSVYNSNGNCNAFIETQTNTLIMGCKNSVIPNTVKVIGPAAFSGCSDLTSITIPNSVTNIEHFAFSGTSLTSVTIPNSVVFLGQGAFYECADMESLTLPNSETVIGARVFVGCTSLKSVTIPGTVKEIGSGAFQRCSNLEYIVSYITDVFETGSYAFYKSENAILYVPKGLVDTYKSTEDWNRITTIKEMSEIMLSLACSDQGKVAINGNTTLSNDIGQVSVSDGIDNTFVFTPEDGYKLERVLINGLDVTKSVKNNQLTTKILPNSKMNVIFSPQAADVNGDGVMDVNDVMAIVNLILNV